MVVFAMACSCIYVRSPCVQRLVHCLDPGTVDPVDPSRPDSDNSDGWKRKKKEQFRGMQVDDQLTGPPGLVVLGVYIGCFLKCWVSSTNPWVFLLKVIKVMILGCFGGYHHLRKHPPTWSLTVRPPEKLQSSHKEKERIVFQAWFFRGYVELRVGDYFFGVGILVDKPWNKDPEKELPSRISWNVTGERGVQCKHVTKGNHRQWEQMNLRNEYDFPEVSMTFQKLNIAPEKWRLGDDPFLLGLIVTFQGANC